MNDPESAPYETLARLIERELELVGQGRFAELASVAAARAALIGSLPPTPPPAARQALRRAQLMHKRLEIELLRGREAILLALARTRLARRTAQGYAPASRRPPRISASA
jgi:hypothetical protein